MISVKEQDLFKEITSKYFDIEIEDIDYDLLCDDLLKMSGAMATVISLLTPDGKHLETVSIAGVSEHLKKASKVFGFEVKGRLWPVDETILEALTAKKVISLGDITQLKPLQRGVGSLLKLAFGIGEVCTVGIISNKCVIGTLTMVMKADTQISEPLNIELFARQIAGLLQRLESEKKKTEAQETSRLVLENSPDLLTIVDKDLNVLYVNKSFYGCEPYQMHGYPIELFLPPVFSKDYLEALKEVFETGQSIEREYEAGEGEKKYYSLHFIPIHKNQSIGSAYIVSKDITIDKTLAEKLKNQNLLLEESGRIARLATWELDIQSGVIHNGRELSSMLEMGTNDTLNIQDVFRLFPSSDQLSLKDSVEKAIETGSGFENETFITTAKGKRKWLRTFAKLKHLYNKPVKIIGITQDTTEYHTSQYERQHTAYQLEQFQNALNNTSIISIINKNGTIKYANDNLSKISKYAGNDLIGKNYSFLFPFAQSKDLWKNLSVVLNQGRIWKGEVQNRAKDGSYYWIETTIIPFVDKEGDITEYLSISNNITEKKEKEKEILQIKDRINDILGSIDDTLWYVDLVSGEHYYGDNAFKMFGYSVAEFMEDLDLWWKIVHPEDIDLVYKNDQLSRLIGHAEFEYRAIRKDRREIMVYARVKIEKNNDGQIVKVFGVFSDITGLRNTENRLNHAQSIAKIGSWELDLRTREYTWSKEHYKIFELTGLPKEQLNDAYRNKFHPEDLLLLDKAIEFCMQTTREYSFEHRIVCNDGSVRYILCIGECVKNEREEVIGLRGVSQDITERKEIEKTLASQNKQIREITDAINQSAMVTRTNSRGIIWYVNDQFVETSGYSAGELIGHRFNVIKSGYHTNEFWEQFWETITAGKIWRGEIKNKTKDGAEYWVYTVVNPIFDENGSIEQYLSVSYDVTERRNAELELVLVKKQMDDIINNVDSAMWSTDVRGNFLFVNKASERLSGYRVENYATQKDLWKQICTPETYRRIGEYNLELFRQGRTEREYEITTSGGEKKWVAAKSKLVKGNDGKPIRIDSIATDITKRIKDEEEIRSAKQKLDSIFNEMEDVVWSLSVPRQELLFITPSVQRMFGFPPEELARDRHSWERIVFGEDSKTAERMTNQLYNGPGFYEEEYRIVDAFGVMRWLRNKGKAIRDDAGRIIRIDGYISDISDSKLTEQILRKNEANLKEAERIAKIGHWELDLLHNRMFWSDTIYEMWGADERMQISTYEDFLKSIHPEDREKVNVAYLQAIENKKQFSVEHRLLMPRGGVKWLRESCRTDYDNQGKAIRSVGIAQDITDMKVSELELLKLKENLEQTSEVAGIGGWELDVTTNKLTWTDITRAIHEVTPDYQPSQEKSLGFYKEGYHRATFAWAMEKAITSGAGFHLEMELVTVSGNVIWAEVIGKAERWAGKVKRVYGTIRNISERKIAEIKIEDQNQFQKIIAEISTNLVRATIADIDRVVNNSLERFGRYLGVERCFVFQINRETNLFTNTHDWNHETIPSYRHRVQNMPLSRFPWFAQEIFRQSVFIVSDIDSFPEEAASEKKEWKTQGMQSILFIRLDNNNYPFGVFGVANNTFRLQFSEDQVAKIKVVSNVISDALTKSKFEMEYINARERAESASKAKTQFLANMSHEIRTPMNAILGFADLLKGKTVSQKHETYLEAILSGGRSLMSLINDILDLSKIEAGKMEIQNTYVNLDALLNELYSVFKLKAEEKQLAYRHEINDATPRHLLIDEVRIRQILFNVIGNALKFTNKGGVTLEVSSLPIAESQDKIQLVFRVSDTGIGIPADQQEVIFKPFKQMDGQSTREYGGTGLGLTITKRLVNMMKGTIQIDSSVGQGTVVTVLLNDIEVTNPPGVLEMGDTTDVEFLGQTLLLVEDIASNREVIKGFLENSNLNIVEAVNGQAGLELLKTLKPDLILMDMMMPVMDGYQATRRIREDKQLSDVPVIALTALALNSNENNIRSICDDYIRKPVSRHDLLATLKNYLDYNLKDITRPETNADKGKLHSGLTEEETNLFLSKWTEVAELQSIDDIQNFASELKLYAENHAREGLLAYAQELLKSTEEFDVDKMVRLFHEFNPHAEK